MRDAIIRTSVLRSLNEKGEPTVRLVLEGLVLQLGAQLIEDAKPCIPTPEIHPLDVYNDNSPQYANICKGSALSLPGAVDDSNQMQRPSIWSCVLTGSSVQDGD